MQQFLRALVPALAVVCLLGLCGVQAHAAGGVTVTPSSINFGVETVGLKTLASLVTVTNHSGHGVQVLSYSLSAPQFQLTQGIAPTVIADGGVSYYTLVFAPTAAQTFVGVFTITIQGLNPFKVSLSGTGRITGAVATLSTTSVNFGSIAEGQSSVLLPITVTNTGTDSVGLVSVTVDPPFVSSTVRSTTLAPGKSLTFNLQFTPSGTGAFIDTVKIHYDTIADEGIDLTGTGTAASALSITTFPTLPAATQNAAYSATLTPAGGAPPYTWKLQLGAVLPTGLTLSTSGLISGTVAANVTAGNHTFGVQVKDSSVPALLAKRQVTIPIGTPTGANCNNIQWDISGTSTPISGLDVLGTGTYLGAQGGLYPNGSDLRPADHDAFGLGLAQAIQPLDANGHPDPNGKYVLIAIGESNVHVEGDGFVDDGTADPSKNQALVLVNAGQGDATAAELSLPTSPFWTTMVNNILPNSGVTAQQVVAAWVEPTDALTSGTFPSDIGPLQSEIEGEIQNLLLYFPNIKLAYLSSRIYSGYSNGVDEINPEPYAFEDSFAVKWAIQDQLDGDPNLNFDPSKGPVRAPWLSWGPYTWADGLVIPSSNGSVWSCQDIKDDGTHPSKTVGTQKVASQILDFFKTDDTTTPWFLAH